MDELPLRTLLRPHILGLGNLTTHKNLDEMCTSLGLPAYNAEGASKADRVEGSFNSAPDETLQTVTDRYITQFKVKATTRNELEDAIWATKQFPEIPKRIRREIAQKLQNPLYRDWTAFDRLLTSLWVIEDESPFDAFFGQTSRNTLRGQIEQHMLRNPDDWDPEYLFAQIGAFEGSHRRFGLFLEGLASADVLLDESAQRAFVGTVNPELRKCGLELRETGETDGYPLFQMAGLNSGPKGKPKNLIFASRIKPDLRLSDAIENEIEVVNNRGQALIYDRPIGGDGLPWNQLQSWWGDLEGITDPIDAKRRLYLRLKSSLPDNSPPQLFLYKAYHECFGSNIPNLPALLPEVWLHWDPKTVKQRGADALLRFRMDFLMLLPHGIRIVIEVDGQQHYSNGDRADPQKYAETMQADRELKLAGYEVFHFGGAELADNQQGRAVAADFFQGLFDRYGVPYSGAPVSEYIKGGLSRAPGT